MRRLAPPLPGQVDDDEYGVSRLHEPARVRTVLVRGPDDHTLLQELSGGLRWGWLARWVIRRRFRSGRAGRLVRISVPPIDWIWSTHNPQVLSSTAGDNPMLWGQVCFGDAQSDVRAGKIHPVTAFWQTDFASALHVPGRIVAERVG